MDALGILLGTLVMMVPMVFVQPRGRLLHFVLGLLTVVFTFVLFRESGGQGNPMLPVRSVGVAIMLAALLVEIPAFAIRTIRTTRKRGAVEVRSRESAP